MHIEIKLKFDESDNTFNIMINNHNQKCYKDRKHFCDSSCSMFEITPFELNNGLLIVRKHCIRNDKYYRQVFNSDGSFNSTYF